MRECCVACIGRASSHPLRCLPHHCAHHVQTLRERPSSVDPGEPLPGPCRRPGPQARAAGCVRSALRRPPCSQWRRRTARAPGSHPCGTSHSARPCAQHMLAAAKCCGECVGDCGTSTHCTNEVRVTYKSKTRSPHQHPRLAVCVCDLKPAEEGAAELSMPQCTCHAAGHWQRLSTSQPAAHARRLQLLQGLPAHQAHSAASSIPASFRNTMRSRYGLKTTRLKSSSSWRPRARASWQTKTPWGPHLHAHVRSARVWARQAGALRRRRQARAVSRAAPIGCPPSSAWASKQSERLQHGRPRMPALPAPPATVLSAAGAP
jgi:hypothetical protein